MINRNLIKVLTPVFHPRIQGWFGAFPRRRLALVASRSRAIRESGRESDIERRREQIHFRVQVFQLHSQSESPRWSQTRRKNIPPLSDSQGFATDTGKSDTLKVTIWELDDLLVKFIRCTNKCRSWLLYKTYGRTQLICTSNTNSNQNHLQNRISLSNKRPALFPDSLPFMRVEYFLTLYSMFKNNFSIFPTGIRTDPKERTPVCRGLFSGSSCSRIKVIKIPGLNARDMDAFTLLA